MGVLGKLFGHSIEFKENFRVWMKDDFDDPIPDVDLVVTNGNYVLNGITGPDGYYDFNIDVGDILDLNVAYTPTIISEFPQGNINVTHSSITGSLFVSNIELTQVGLPKFTCDIQTFNENGNSLNKALSNNENTVVKAIFTNISNEAVDPNLYRCIIRQWPGGGSTDEGIIETLESVIISSSVGFQIIYQITLTPQQVAQIGDRISARLIEL